MLGPIGGCILAIYCCSFVCDVALSFLSCPKYTNPTLAIMLTTGNAGDAGYVFRRALLFFQKGSARGRYFQTMPGVAAATANSVSLKVAPPIKINKDHTVLCYSVGRTYLDIKMKI